MTTAMRIACIASGIVAGILVAKSCEAQQIPCPVPCINPYAVLPQLPTLPSYVPPPSVAQTPPWRPYQPPTVYVPQSGQTMCQTIEGVTYCTK